MVVKKKTMRRRSVKKNVRKSVRRNLNKSSKRNVRKSSKRNVRKSVRRNSKRNVRKSVRRMSSKRNVRKSVRRMSSKRNVRKSVRRGGAYKYKPGAVNVPIDMIDRCLSNLNLTGPDDFATGDSPGESPTIRRERSRWPWRGGGGNDFMDIFNTTPPPVKTPEPVETPKPVKTPERINRGNKKEGVEGARLQIYELKEKAQKANEQFIDTIELRKVLPDIPKVNDFINCLTTSQEGAVVQ